MAIPAILRALNGHAINPQLSQIKQTMQMVRSAGNPNANTCIKLAAFLTIQREMFPQSSEPFNEPPPVYSYANQPEPAETITYDSGTEFSRLVNGQSMEDVLSVIDELMDVLHTINKRLYDGVIRKLEK